MYTLCINFPLHYVKPYTRTTKDCDYNSRLSNVLKRDFNPSKPNAAWCTDITYIWTYDEGFVYLTSIMGLFSRKIISWSLSKTMEVDEVLSCLEEAKLKRDIVNPIVIQNDYTDKKTIPKLLINASNQEEFY